MTVKSIGDFFDRLTKVLGAVQVSRMGGGIPVSTDPRLVSVTTSKIPVSSDPRMIDVRGGPAPRLVNVRNGHATMIDVKQRERWIAAQPGKGESYSVDVVNTLESPTAENVPQKWSQVFMGPGQPFASFVPTSTRDEDAEKEPRSMQYVANVNSTIAPRIAWGLTPFAELRQFAEGVPEVAGAVRLLTEEVKAFVPALVNQDESDADVPEMKWMTTFPDRVNPWPVWISRFLYNVLVYDAPAVFKMREERHYEENTLHKGKHRRRTSLDPQTGICYWYCDNCGAGNAFKLGKNDISEEIEYPTACESCGSQTPDHAMQKMQASAGFGDEGGWNDDLEKSFPVQKINGLRIIDGSTIFVLIDERGESPEPPFPAFTQVIWGVPRMFLNTHQLWYRPRHLRADAPYGRSFIEDSKQAVELLANLWDFEKEKYVIGNIPEMAFTLPVDWGLTPDQILEFETAYNARMSGSNKERARARFFPSGTTVLQTKDISFNMEGYNAAVNTVRMAVGIPKSEAGEAPEGMMGGKGYAEAMQSSFYRMGLSPLLTFIESLFNEVLQENGYYNVKFKLKFPNDSLDPETEEGKWQGRFSNGIATRDEARMGIGMEPLGGEEGKLLVGPSGADGGAGGAPGDMQGPPPPDQPMPPSQPSEPAQPEMPDTSVPSPFEPMLNPIAVKMVETEELQKPDKLEEDVEFALGMKEEQEHAATVRNDQHVIEQIVRDHLAEDPKYYTHLKEAGMIEDDGRPATEAVATPIETGDPDDMNLKKYFGAVDLIKHCGVCAEDDQYFGMPVIAPAVALMPHQGANDSRIVAIGAGELEARPAVWKPQTGEKADLVDWAGGDMYRRAEAAYLLDRELSPDPDSHLVPVTYIHDMDGVQGSVQHYIAGNIRRKGKRTAAEYDSKWTERAAILDYIMGQLDRIHKNWLTHPEDNSRMILIDNDLSFCPNDEPIRSDFVDYMAGKPLSETNLQAIYFALGNGDLWSDLMTVLEDQTAVEKAQNRAREILGIGMIPASAHSEEDPDEGEEVSEDPAISEVVSHPVNKAFDPEKHPRGQPENAGEFTERPSNTDSPQFKRWFKNSKVVNPDGSPMVVYHGTGAKKNFDEFVPGKMRGMQMGFGIHFTPKKEFADTYAVGKKGRVINAYLSIQNPLKANQIVAEGSPEWAVAERIVGKRKLAGFSRRLGMEDDSPRGCYLQNVIDAAPAAKAAQVIQESGYDGVEYDAIKIGHHGTYAYAADRARSFVVFDSSQIKLTSNTEFNPEEKSIRKDAAVAAAPAGDGGHAGFVAGDVPGIHLVDQDKEEEETASTTEKDGDVKSEHVFNKFMDLMMAQQEALNKAQPQQPPNITINLPQVVIPEVSPTFHVTMPDQPAPQVTVNVPDQAAPQVNVTLPEQMVKMDMQPVNVTVNTPPQEAPQVTVNIPDQPAPQVTVNVPEQLEKAAPVINVIVPEQAAPQVTVNVPEQPAPVVNVKVPKQDAPIVNVTIPEDQSSGTIVIDRDADGRMIGAHKE